MKAFFITLLLLAAAFAFYDFAIAPNDQKLLFGPHSIPSTTPTAAPSASAPAQPQSPSKSASPAPAPTPTDAGTSFVPPQIASLEEVTQNWTLIPERAFPRQVVLKQPTAIRMAAGTAELGVGTSVTALAAAAGQLTVAPTPTSSARGTVPVLGTDLPDQIRTTYEVWKSHRIELARKIWEARQSRTHSSLADTSAPAGAIDPAGKPTRSPDGTYPLLLASIHSGQVNDIDPDTISRWGSAQPGTVAGQPGWLVNIDFVSHTIFGPIPTQAQAQIAQGRVQRWIYTGSQEEVQ
ncbi:MAG: hypothetical protein KDK99_03725 [Verrucomicrobiales bacterium]|nr:hypothetical protein [Verrucomicrobiales bacterium]